MKRSYSIGAAWVVWAVLSLLLAGAVPHHHHYRTICLFGACCETGDDGCGGASSEENNCVGRVSYLPGSGSEERCRAVSSADPGIFPADFYYLSPERVAAPAVAERAVVCRSFPVSPARCSASHAVSYGRRAPPESFV